MSIFVGIATGLVLTSLHLEAFGLGLICAVAALLQLFLLPGLGLGILCWGIKNRRAKTRRVGLALILSTVASFVLSRMLLDHKVGASKAAGDALCLALESCRKRDGRYPQDLQSLVPSFLSSVPATSMGVFRSIPFDYRVEPQSDDYILGFDSTFFIYCARSRAATWRCDDQFTITT